jgi:cytochrome c biogenesis protein CcmG, thiol:disulfide interchange protein DsbE
MDEMSRIGRLEHVMAVAAAAAFVFALSACGSESSGGSGGKVPDYQRALGGAPKPLSALYDQAGQLLPGGTEAFQKRLAELRGYPVVVNNWASWCGPCREEFPLFQRLSAEMGKRIAFVGVDSDDSSAAARTFLKDLPVPYPSYSDPDEEIRALLKTAAGLPGTAFYDSKGELAYVKLGQYASESDLAADIKRYAR